MTDQTATDRLRIAIIGSGPSGFYAADFLLKSEVSPTVHMFERLPTPYGLVRYGVAPDHAKIRNVINVYAKTAAHADFHFYGNVNIGYDITLEELRQHFDAIILAYGSSTDRHLNIPGEDLPRSYTATEFCAWYNGHPDYRDHNFDFSHETAVVIGQGNVAMDVTRILATPAEKLAATDMAVHAVEALKASKIKNIHCIGRRGPVQAAFTPKEIAELGAIEDCDVIVNPADLEIDEVSRAFLESGDRPSAKRNFDVLTEFAQREPTGASRRIYVRFFQSPVSINGEGMVESVTLVTNELTGEPGAERAVPTEQTETLPCGLFFRSVGYKGVPLPGAPFDEKRAIVPNEKGRVSPGLYTVGWIKNGPAGLIGTNKKDSEETVAQLLEDASSLAGAPHRENDHLNGLLADRGIRVVSYEDWLKIDTAEVERGKAAGKPRGNFTTVDEMLAVLD